jgi:hypothetical protein
MEATPVRVRLGSALEWFVAALFLVATCGVGVLIVRELRMTPAAPVQAAAQGGDSLPSAIPARAISVPVLLLHDGKQVKVGDSVEAVAATLGRGSEVGRQLADRGAHGDRLTRFYDSAGTRFVLVFEATERNGALCVAGIYLQ